MGLPGLGFCRAGCPFCLQLLLGCHLHYPVCVCLSGCACLCAHKCVWSVRGLCRLAVHGYRPVPCNCPVGRLGPTKFMEKKAPVSTLECTALWLPCKHCFLPCLCPPQHCHCAFTSSYTLPLYPCKSFCCLSSGPTDNHFPHCCPSICDTLAFLCVCFSPIIAKYVSSNVGARCLATRTTTPTCLCLVLMHPFSLLV